MGLFLAGPPADENQARGRGLCLSGALASFGGPIPAHRTATASTDVQTPSPQTAEVCQSVAINLVDGGQKVVPTPIAGGTLLQLLGVDLVLAKNQPLKNGIHQTFTRVDSNGNVYDLREYSEIFLQNRQLFGFIQSA